MSPLHELIIHIQNDIHINKQVLQNVQAASGSGDGFQGAKENKSLEKMMSLSKSE